MTYKSPLHDAEDTCLQSARLQVAVEDGDLAAVRKILASSSHYVNIPCGAVRVTALQLAAIQGASGLEILRELLKHGAQADISDKLGRSPLHLAAATGCEEAVHALLRAGAQVNTVFQVGTQDRQSGKNDVQDGGSFECYDVSTGSKLPVPECWGRTPLHQAVKGCHPDVVRLLLEAGASVNAQDERGLTPLLLAGAGIQPKDCASVQRFEDILQQLIKAGASVHVQDPATGLSALLHAAVLRSAEGVRMLIASGASINVGPGDSTALHYAAYSGNVEVVQVVLDGGGECLVNLPDQKGRTPLHKAAYAGARKVVTLLLEHGGDLSATTSSGITVADAILSHIPRPIFFLTDLLDSCIKPNCASINDRDFKIQLDFSPLCPNNSDRQMGVVRALMDGCGDAQQESLFQHPLLELFIRMKWSRLRVYFLALMVVQIAFVASLSVYVAMLVQHDSKEYELTTPRRILLVTSVVLFLYGMGQILLLPLHYIRESETWLHLVSASLSFAVAFMGELLHQDVFFNPELPANATIAAVVDMDNKAEHLPKTVLHMMSLAVLSSWAELMLLVGRFPTWGYYALMFQAVLSNVLKVLMAFICLVVGFALSFSVQFHDHPAFSDPWRAIVKTTVMMMGEFEYNELFDETKGMLRLPVTSRVIFMIFVVLAPIVLMNLMVGLAVSDIQALQTLGVIRRLLKQADFVAHLETLSTHRILQSRFVPLVLLRLMEARRKIATVLSVQPVVLGHGIPYSLLERIVSVAISNQTRARRLTVSRHRASDTESLDDTISLETPSLYVDHGGTAVLDALHTLSSQVASIQRQLDMDHAPVQTQRHAVKPRFSEAIAGVQGANGFLRRVRNSARVNV